MPQFSYTAVEHSGTKQSAEIEAADTDEALSALRARGLTPVLLRPVTQSWWHKLNQPLDLGKALSKSELAFVTQQLSVLLSARLDVDEALALAADQAESAKTRHFLEGLERHVKEGWTLSKALMDGPKVPRFYAGIIASAETGGDLSRAFADLAAYLERSEDVAQKIKGALIYPTIVLTMVLASLVVVLRFVIPRFEPVFQGIEDQLPLLTQAVLFASRTFNTHLPLLVIGLCLTIGGISYVVLQPSLRQRFDQQLLSLKGLGPILYQNSVAKVLRVLGTSLRNGVALAPALDLAAQAAGNRFVQDVFDTSAAQIREGRSFSQTLHSVSGFPKVAKNLVRVGESASELPAMLLKAAEILERNSRTKMDRFINILNPLATIGLGGIVAALVAGVMLGILSLSQIGL